MRLGHVMKSPCLTQPFLFQKRGSEKHMVLYLSMPNVTRVDGQPVAAYKSLVMPGDKYWRIVFLGSK